MEACEAGILVSHAPSKWLTLDLLELSCMISNLHKSFTSYYLSSLHHRHFQHPALSPEQGNIGSFCHLPCNRSLLHPMDSPFIVQGANWKHHVFSKHGSSSGFHSDLGSRARITILITAAFAAVLFLLVRRLTTGAPFFQPKNYRSFTVYNKKDFLHLYDEDEVPSQAPIEPLEGVLPSQFYGRIWRLR